jgi:PhzF family phenazine biosynthesis protein
MKKIPLYQVDAFTSKLFKGNAAAVCVLDSWLPDAVMQSIGMENNMSETAFIVPKDNDFELRWFTPKVEVDLCGHATLAAAFVIFDQLRYQGNEIGFVTQKAGMLKVTKKENLLTLDFPSRPAQNSSIPDYLIEGLGGVKPKECWLSRDYMVVFDNEEKIRSIVPDFKILNKIGKWVCITAKGKEVDFVSRFFCAGDGIDEDPVTGSSHCMLTPYWAEKLKKNKLKALQLSERGGELECELVGDRVLISGEAKLFFAGHIFLE